MTVASASSPPPSSAATHDTHQNGSSSRGTEPSVGDDEQEMRKILANVLKDRTNEGGAVVKTVSSVPGETCTWYANKQCNVARTCYDCLNTRLAGNTQICMVDNYGVCVSMSQYVNDKDFRRLRPPNVITSTSNQYPSTNATYCANNDKYCAICRNSWGNPFDNSQLSFLPFCRGVGGCVCIQACESPYHNDNVIMQRCVAYGYSAPSAATIYTSLGFMAALCCVVAVVALFVRRWVRRSRANRTQAFRHDQPLPPRQPSGPQLGLSGWRSMREKLIETEREQLQTGNDPIQTIPVLDGTIHTAIVEETDGYLLATSPSVQESTTSVQLAPPLSSADGDNQERPPSTQPPPLAATTLRPVPSTVTEL